MRGSRAVLSIWMPTRPSEGTQIVQPVVGAVPGDQQSTGCEIEIRLAVLVLGDGSYKRPSQSQVQSQVAVTRQSSWTKGRNSFQRRPVVAPKNV